MDARIIKLEILCLLFLVLVIFLFALRSIPPMSLVTYISPDSYKWLPTGFGQWETLMRG